MLKRLGLILIRLGIIFFICIVMSVLFLAYINNHRINPSVKQISYSEFISELKNGRVKQIELADENAIIGSFVDGVEFLTYGVNDQHLIDDLLTAGVIINGRPKPSFTLDGLISILITVWIPMLLSTAIFIFYTNRNISRWLKK